MERHFFLFISNCIVWQKIFANSGSIEAQMFNGREVVDYVVCGGSQSLLTSRNNESNSRVKLTS